MSDELDNEWEDGDDSGNYDRGYEDGLNDARAYAIKSLLDVSKVDGVSMIPIPWTLQRIAADFETSLTSEGLAYREDLVSVVDGKVIREGEKT